MRSSIFTWALLGFILYWTFSSFQNKNQDNLTQIQQASIETDYNAFIVSLKERQFKQVVIHGIDIYAVLNDGSTIYHTVNPGDTGLVGDLLASGTKIITKKVEPESLGFGDILISWFPMLLLIAVWIFFMRKSGMGSGNMGGMMGKSKAKMLNEDTKKTKMIEVAGCDEAKEEVGDFINFLREPSKYTKLGADIPRGALLVGPPGTGKTLLARAIATEAGVPFFTISGSDFVEMFVGVGASRVRDMFEQAKKQAPCIIFIDEIDAVGRQRGTGMGGGHDEREQTLNQLLVEMDGFTGNEGVIVIAATNRVDVLDPALLRPGRFDRQVSVSLPDVKGRNQILLVHLKKRKCVDDIDPMPIARGTPGFSGADCMNVVNEAALFAAKMNAPAVTNVHLEKAKDKILMGAERPSMVMDEDEKKLTAYHEAGHCVVGRLVPEHDSVYKVSIMPRGRALGITMFLPKKDQHSLSKIQLESQISSLYGGRLAEEIFFGEEYVTTGASNDIERATELAIKAVTEWGLDKSVRPMKYGSDEGSNPFLGKTQGVTGHKTSFLSDELKDQINTGINGFIDRNYDRAERLINDNKEIMHAMADALMKYETIDEKQIDNLMLGKPVGEPEGWEEIVENNKKENVINGENKAIPVTAKVDKNED